MILPAKIYKICSNCGELEKSQCLFTKIYGKPKIRCKKCVQRDAVKYRALHRAKIRAADNARFQQDKSNLTDRYMRQLLKSRFGSVRAVPAKEIIKKRTEILKARASESN